VKAKRLRRGDHVTDGEDRFVVHDPDCDDDNVAVKGSVVYFPRNMLRRVPTPDMKDMDRRLREGSRYTKAELRFAIDYFEDLRSKLNALGPRWYITGNEASRLLNLCRSYLDGMNNSP